MPDSATLPIIDLADLDRGDDARKALLDRLRTVTHEIGFFHLAGHGIEESSARRLIASSREFFALPEADKLEIENSYSPHFRGYTRVGGEHTQGYIDWREQLDIGPEREAVTDIDPTRPWEVLHGPTSGRRRCHACAKSPSTGSPVAVKSGCACFVPGPNHSEPQPFSSTMRSPNPIRSSRSPGIPVTMGQSRIRGSVATRTSVRSPFCIPNPAAVDSRSNATEPGSTSIRCRALHRQHRRTPRIRHRRLSQGNRASGTAPAGRVRPGVTAVLPQPGSRQGAAHCRAPRRPGRCRKRRGHRRPRRYLAFCVRTQRPEVATAAHPNVTDRYHTDLARSFDR